MEEFRNNIKQSLKNGFDGVNGFGEALKEIERVAEGNGPKFDIGPNLKPEQKLENDAETPEISEDLDKIALNQENLQTSETEEAGANIDKEIIHENGYENDDNELEL